MLCMRVWWIDDGCKVSTATTYMKCVRATRKETRLPKRIITPAQIREMERLSENEGLEGRSLPWLQLGFEAQVDASETTIRRALGSLDYHKCLACQRGWVSFQQKKQGGVCKVHAWKISRAWGLGSCSIQRWSTLWMGPAAPVSDYTEARRTILCQLYSAQWCTEAKGWETLSLLGCSWIWLQVRHYFLQCTR